MQGLTELIPFLLEEGDSEMWDDFLKTLKELCVFTSKASESVSLINSLLNEPDTRFYGLKLLEIFVAQCPRNIISEHIIQWFHQCIKAMVQQVSKGQYSLSCSILSILLEASTEYPDVHKQTSQIFVPKILDCISDRLKDGSHDHNTVLICLFSCLFYYGKSCGNQKDNMEKLLLNLLLSERKAVHNVSKCFILLAQTGQPGADCVNYKQSWHSQHLIVINSLHSVLDELFSDVNEILGGFNLPSSEKRKFNLPIINDENPFIKYHKLNRLFCGLCEILESMLLNTFPTSKKIHPQAIFGIICRALAITTKSLESNISNATYSLMSYLCAIHFSALKLFNSLIVCSRSNLLPFSSLVCKLFIQILKWTDVKDWVHGREKPFSLVRQTAYKCLLSWLSVGKSCSLNETQINIIVECIIKDIKFDKKVVCLKLEKKTKSKNSRKSTGVGTSDKTEMNASTCCAALACLPLILRTPIPSVVVKNLQEVVVKLLFSIQRVLRCDKELPPPYSNPGCRASLYSTLLALCISPHPQFPPPLHYANVLFNASSSDNDIEVQRVCSNAVNSIAHILRPCAPSFDFHSELDAEVIPINVYSEPSKKDVDSLSRRSYQEFMSRKLQEEEEIKDLNPEKSQNCKATDSTSGMVLSNNLPIDTNQSSANNSKSATKKSEKNELINLDDSSDESLILMDSDVQRTISGIKDSSNDNSEKIDQSKEVNNSKISMDSSDLPDGKSDTCNESQNVNKRRLKKSNTVESSILSKINSEETQTELKDLKNSVVSSNKKKNGKNTDAEVIELDYQAESEEISIISEKRLDLPINEDDTLLTVGVKSLQKTRISSKKSKPGSNNINDCNAESMEESDLTEDCNVPLRRTRSSKTVTVIDTIDLDDLKVTGKVDLVQEKTDEDVTVVGSEVCPSESEDVCIIEPSVLKSPLTRSKRHSKLSSKPNQSNSLISNMEEMNIASNGEPLPKRLRSNKNVSSDISFSKLTHNNSEVSIVDDDDSICEVDDEDEMMNSFVDSVPD